MPAAHLGTPTPRKAPAPTRLNSWKEIASYLSKGERTVKRWEHERSLPIHHVPGGGHGSVYAFTIELDEWLLSQRTRDAKPGDEKPAALSEGVAPKESAAERRTSEANGAVESGGLGHLGRILLYAFLILAAALIIPYVSSPRTTRAYTSFLRTLARSRAGAASNVSDPEKRLAHDLYLRGRFEWNKRTPESLNRALDYFTQAVVHDPSNAQAFVGLADTYNLLREYTMMPENEAYQRAIAAAKKAIQLDDSLAEAHRSLAFDEIWGNWDFEAGEREFQLAIELNPRDPITHLWFANAFAAPGWYPLCLREMDRAQELDPSSQAILADKGLMLFHAGQMTQGLELVKQVERTDPEFLSPHRYLADMYISLRNYPGFLQESERSAELSHDPVLKLTTAAARAGLERQGERGLWHDLYSAQKKFYAEEKLPGTFLAITCVRIGNREEALQLMRREFQRHGSTFLMFRQNPELLTLSKEPEYQELMGRIRAPAPEASWLAPAGQLRNK